MSARNLTEEQKAGEFFTRGVMRMMTVAMPGREELTEVEIIEAIPLDRIDPSPLNRTEFDAEKMSELVQSLQEHGQTTPAIVRPKADGRLELVAGERRWRACGVAKIPTLNCVVRSYSDNQAAEILLIENLEREDLKPTEEARIYQRLLELTDESGTKLYTLERIAERVHNDAKKVDRVARVLTILNLPSQVKKALDAGEIGVHVAFLVARIADPEDRKKAGEVVLKGQHGEGPMTAVKARDFVCREYQVNLKGAKFDREDPDILSEEQKEALGYTGAFGQANDGSCERCPWLAKNHPVYQQELAVGGHGKKGVVGIDPLTCTRAKCHELKLEAVWQREAAVFAKKHGAERVLTRRESEVVHVWNSEFVALDDKPAVNDTGNFQAAKDAPLWSKLLKGAGVPLIVSRNMDVGEGGGAPMLVVERALAIEAARKVRPDLFIKAKVEGQTGAKVVLSDEELEAQRKAEFERKLELAVDERMKRVVLEELMESIGSGGLSLDGLRGLFDSISRNVDHLGALARWVLPDYDNDDDSEWPEKEMREYMSAVNADGLMALCVVAAVMDDVMWSGPEQAADFQTIAKGQGMDIKAIKKRVEKEVKKKLEAEAKAAAVAEKEELQRKNRNAMEEIQKRTVLEETQESRLEDAREVAAEPREVEVKDVAAFVEQLIGVEVSPTRPNENGVFTEPVSVRLTIGKVWVAIELAQSEGGLWATGYRYGGKPVEQVNSGGGLPRVSGLMIERLGCVETEVSELIEHLKEKPYKALVAALGEARVVLAQKSSGEEMKARCREWRAANPGKGFQAMADELGISIDEAFKLGDELIDEEYAADLVSDIEARPVAKTKAMPEAEKLAWETYLETGSIEQAATAAGVAVDTVKNWHKRRGWKGLRAAELGV